ncbi:MAG: multidrug MFS transporter [Lentisphaerae bacterium]|nr:multidrug MFS transporter [Lentisphaerota bacterium]
MDLRRIVMDCREHADDLARCLVEHHGFDLERAMLPLGDYRLGTGTLVERKTTQDFALSIIDGRLFSQAYRLVIHEDHPILIVEGMTFEGAVGLSMPALRGAFITLAQSFRLPVLRTRDQADTAWTLAQLFEQRCRVGHASGLIHGSPGRRLQARKEAVLQALPGVGPTLAQRLLQHFGSVAAVMGATAAELKEVYGVGPQRAAALVETLHEAAAAWSAGGAPAPEAGPPGICL